MKKFYFILFIVLLGNFSNAQCKIGEYYFPSLDHAIAGINLGMFTGNIVVEITASHAVTTSMNLNESGVGNANYNSVKIIPSGGGARTVTLIESGSLQLNQCENVTIDGLNANGNSLTFSSESYAPHVISIEGGQHNTVTNCTVLGGTYDGTIKLTNSSFGNAITNCNIGGFGPYVPKIAINAFGNSNALLIENNNIYDFASADDVSYGILLGGASDYAIKNNRLYQTAAHDNQEQYAIHVASGYIPENSISNIQNNYIGGSNSDGTGTYALNGGRFSAIYLNQLHTSNTCQITGNAIKNIVFSTISQGEALGLIHVDAGAVFIQNNTIGGSTGPISAELNAPPLTESVGTPTRTQVYGIYKDGEGNSLITDNSIGGINISTSVSASIDFIGIHIKNDSGDTTVTTLCMGNQLGISGPIVCNVPNELSSVIGIFSDRVPGPIAGNTVANLTGFGTHYNLLSNLPDFGVIGIRLHEFNGGTVESAISDNIVYNLTNLNNAPDGHTYVGGILQNSSNGNTIQRNFVHSLHTFSNDPTSLIEGISSRHAESNIINNMVDLGNSEQASVPIYGIRTNPDLATGERDIKNNSVYIGGTAMSGTANTYCYYQSFMSLGDNFNHNNIFVNNRSNGIFAHGSHSSIRVPSNDNSYFRGNIYHGTGSTYVLGFVGEIPKTTLDTWNSGSHATENYGYLADPKFINPTGTLPNLHINTAVSTTAEAHGYDSPSQDIDRQLRTGLTPHDIGADAGNFAYASAPILSTIVAPTESCAGIGTIIVTGHSLSDIIEFKIGNTIIPIAQVYPSGIGIETMIVHPMVAASGIISLAYATGTIISTTSVTVHPVPIITAHPQNRTVCQSSVTTFSVVATNGVSYQWRRNGIALTEGGIYSNVTGATLTVTNPSFSDSGAFDVVVTEASGNCSVTSNIATLTSNGQLIELGRTVTGDICDGGSVTLEPMMETPALQFDGVDDYFDFAGENYGSFTMAFWIKTTQTGATGAQWLNGNGIIDGQPAADNGYAHFGTALVGNKLAFGYHNGGSTYTLFSNADINTGQWVHVAVTYNSSLGEFQIYINGQLDATGQSFVGAELSNTIMRVGSLLSGSGYFAGAIDDIRIWGRQMVAAEIQNVRNGAVNTSLLYQNIAMNENSGSNTLESNYGNNLVLNNGVQWTSRLAPATLQDYNWSNGLHTRTITVTQSGDYSVYGTNGGCINTSNPTNITIGPPNVMLQTQSFNYCGNQPLELTALGAETYTWSPATGLSATTGSTVYASPSATTFYMLTGTNAAGCQTTINFPVFVEQPMQLAINASHNYIASGGMATLTASGGTGVYNWSPSAGLNTVFGATVLATPTQTTTYTVTGTNCDIPQSFTVYVLPANAPTDNALDFDGIDDYVSMPVQTQSVSGTFTIAMWVKPSHPTKTMHLFSSRNGTQLRTFDIQIKDGNTIHANIGDGNNWLTAAADAFFPYQPNQWMHIAYKITPGQYKIYVNGNLIQTGGFPGTAVLYGTNNFITLGNSQSENTFFQGTIDDLMIATFDFPDEVMQNAPLYNIPATNRYLFDEGIAGGNNPTVTILSDQNLQSTLHGTLHNFALNGPNSNWVVGQSREQQTIALTSENTVVYGTNPYNPGAVASSGLPVTYYSSDPSIAMVAGNVLTILNTGTVTIHAEQQGNPFYFDAMSQNQLLTVTPKTLMLANAVAQNKTYDRNTSATITGTLSGVVGSDAVSFTGMGTFASFNVNNAITVASDVTLIGADASKYTLTQPIGLSANITPKNITVSGAVAANKIYDGTTAATINGAALNGVISPDVVNIASHAGTFASPNVGNMITVTSQLALGGAAAFNYTLTQPTGLSANITPTLLTATISGTAAICQGQNTVLQVAISGAGLFTVQYTDGTLIYTLNNYSSGNNIVVAPVSTSTYTLVSVTGSNAQVSVGGSTTVTVNANITYYADADGDGFGDLLVTASMCNGAPLGYVANNFDCDDHNNAVYQTATFYVDADFDGYTSGATASVCYGATIPAGFLAALTAVDCNDAIAAIRPNAVEIPFNGVDDNCNGVIDETGTITTSLLASSCGTTLTSIGSLVGITTVAGHPITGYRIRVTQGSQTQIIETNVPHFSMTQFPSYAYATTYTVAIQLQRAGLWQADWGTSCLVSTPAILESGAAGSVNPSQCGITLAKINTLIATTSLAAVTGYRFRVTNLTDEVGPNAVQIIDRTQNWFSLQMLTRYNYGTTYRIEVAVKTTGTYGGFGAPCQVSSPPVPSLVNCSATITYGTTLIAATSISGVAQYRFQITRQSDNATTTIDRNTNYFIFNMVPASVFTAGGLYSVRVAVMTTGTWSPFGDVCEITAPGGTAKGIIAVETPTSEKVFRATVHPNPFSTTFAIEVQSSISESVELKVYDMLGRLVETRTAEVSEINQLELGQHYPSGVYQVIVGQGDDLKTLRVVKR